MRALVASCIAGLACTSGASAVTYSFYAITNNSGVSGSVATQLRVDVDPSTQGSPYEVMFHFYWVAGANTMSITNVYFDDGTLLGAPLVVNSPGVNFSSAGGETPPNLPGGSNATPPFVTTQAFSADSQPPVQTNGVNSTSEFVDLHFQLQSGQNFADTIAALESGELRIGLHVQSINGGTSDSFVNTVVPLPPAAWAGLASLSGVMGMFYVRRRNLRS